MNEVSALIDSGRAKKDCLNFKGLVIEVSEADNKTYVKSKTSSISETEGEAWFTSMKKPLFSAASIIWA